MSAFDQLARLSNPRVPNLSADKLSLLTLMTGASVDIGQAAEALERHPVIAARLIGLANCAWSSPVTETTNLKDACTRLGLSVIKSVSIAYTVAAPFNSARCPAFDAERFWCCSLLGAEGAGLLAAKHGVDHSLAKTAGLLRHLGLLWLADGASEATQEALAACDDDPDSSLTAFLTQSVGVSHIQATHQLLTVWGLSNKLRDSCDPCSDSALADICRISSQLAADAYLDSPLPCTTSVSADTPEVMEEIGERLKSMAERTTMVARSIAA